MIDTLNRLGIRFAEFAWPMFWQSSLLVLIIAAVDYALLKKSRPAIRYGLWLVIFVKLAIPPSFAFPTGVAWWFRSPAPTAAVTKSKPVIISFGPATAVPIIEAKPASIPAQPKPHLSRQAVILVGSASMSLIISVGILFQWLQVARHVRLTIYAPAEIELLLMRAGQRSGIRRRIRLRLTTTQLSPAVCGIFRPLILLPEQMIVRLSPAQIEAVLLHELIHVQRGDVWVNAIQAIFQMVYWWHPLIWIANSRIRRLREESVDDAVMIGLREDADGYAPTLLEVARLALNRPSASLGLVGILESKSALRHRVERLVNFREPGGNRIRFGTILGIILFSAAALPMGEAPAKQDNIHPRSIQEPIDWKSQPASENPTEFEARFLIVDADSFRAVLPNLDQAPTPLLVEPGDVKELERLLQRATVQHISDVGTVGFTKSIEGSSRWRVENGEGKGIEKPTETIDGAVSLPSARSDWIPLDFTITPASGREDMRCQMEFKLDGKTNSSFKTEVLLPSGGAFLWASTEGVSSGKCQMVVVRRAASTNSAELSQIGTTNTGSGSLNSPQRKATQAAHVLQEAKLCYEQGKFEQAEGFLKQVTALEPENAGARYYAAMINQARLKPVQHVTAPPDNAAPGATPTNSFRPNNRQEILQKLKEIHLSVSFEQTPLSDAMSSLSDKAKTQDSMHRGINLILNTSGIERSGESESILGLPITLHLVDVSLLEILDALVRVSPRPMKWTLESYAVLLALKGDESVPLFTRIMKLDPNTFGQILKSSGTTPGGHDDSGSEAHWMQAKVRNFFTNLGIDFAPPQAVFYKPQEGSLLIRTTRENLDKVEAEIQRLNTLPRQISLTACLFEVPLVQSNRIGFSKELSAILMGGSASNEKGNAGDQENQPKGGLSATLTSPQVRLMFDALSKQNGVDRLNNVTATTLSDRQVQLQVTDMPTIVKGINPKARISPGVTAEHGSAPAIYVTETLPVGPVLDVYPTISQDGASISLRVHATITEFIGYDQPASKEKVFVNGRSQKVTPPLPHIRVRTVEMQRSVEDGQTWMVGSMEPQEVSISYDPKGTKTTHPVPTNKAMFIFITPTIIDASGNPLHKGEI